MMLCVSSSNMYDTATEYKYIVPQQASAGSMQYTLFTTILAVAIVSAKEYSWPDGIGNYKDQGVIPGCMNGADCCADRFWKWVDDHRSVGYSLPLGFDGVPVVYRAVWANTQVQTIKYGCIDNQNTAKPISARIGGTFELKCDNSHAAVILSNGIPYCQRIINMNVKFLELAPEIDGLHKECSGIFKAEANQIMTAWMEDGAPHQEGKPFKAVSLTIHDSKGRVTPAADSTHISLSAEAGVDYYACGQTWLNSHAHMHFAVVSHP